MAEPAKIDLNRIKRGDTYMVDFFFTDTDGTKDISAVTITAQARRELDGAVWFDLNPVKVNAAEGHFRIHLTAFQTRDITESPPGSFSGIYDIQFSWSGATEVYVATVVSGSIAISKDVTYPDVNVPVGGTSYEPAPDQEIAVYFSLNPGQPNYSDVVTAEELTPAQYQIAASLGLANVNAINEAAESARLAKGYRDESAAYSQSASQSASLATVQAATATQKAAEAKQYRDEAAAIVTGGTATVDPSPGKIPLANAEGKISSGWLTALAFARTKADMDAMRASVNRQCAASGMLHAGKHYERVGYPAAAINEGMFSVVASGYENKLAFGVIDGATYTGGVSETPQPVFNMAGFPLSINGINYLAGGYQQANLLKFLQAPDGTDIYDRSGNCRGTGKPTLNLLTEVDPKYGDVAPNLNEAVARAFEGMVKNGDFRNGTNYWTSFAGTTISANGGVLTAVGGNVTDKFYPDNLVYFELDREYELEINIKSLTHPLRLFISTITNYVDFTTAGKHTVRFKSLATASKFVQLEVRANGAVYEISNLSVRPVTEEVVTERVDLSGLEAYLEEITPAKPYIYPYCGINNQATSVDGIPTTVDNVRPITYFANFDGDTTSRGRGWNLNDLTDSQLLKILQNHYHHVYVIDGKLVQLHVRPRQIAGAGNGDWANFDTAKSAELNFGGVYTRVSVQGARDSIPTYSSSYPYVNKLIATESYVSKTDPALFYARKLPANDNCAYNGECYFYVLATVLRLNQGAYHPSFNPLGTGQFSRDLNNSGKVDQGVLWNNSFLRQELSPKTKADCFGPILKYNSDIAGPSRYSHYIDGFYLSGSIASDRPGRPDGRFYDAIYPDGVGGVIDRRLSAFPITMEDYFKAIAKAENGSMRGMEKLPRSKPFLVTYQGAIKQDPGTLIYIGGAFEFLTKSVLKPDGMYPNMRCNGYIISQVGTDSNGNYIYIHNSEGDVSAEFPLGTPVILTTDETNISVSGNFLQTDVIGDPANILQVDALKDGWMGSWIPQIPDGVKSTFQLTRKNLQTGNITRLFTYDDGVTWTQNQSTFYPETNTNITLWGADVVNLYQYTASAKVTKPSAVLPVYGDEAGISSVRAVVDYWPTSGVFLAEGLMGKVLTSNAGIRSVKLPLSSFSLPASGKLLYSAAYHPMTHAAIPLTAPSNNSPAVKILPHAVSDNGQATLGFVWNELIWGSPTYIVVTDENYATWSAGKLYEIRVGWFRGFYRCESNSNLPVSWPQWVESANHIYASSNGLRYFTKITSVLSGKGWGDDGTMRVIDNTGTYNNLNGESCLYGYAELALPIGWVDNHARFGAQVPGVDL